MGIKIPAEVRAAMTEIARKFGKQGGKKAAQNMTPEQRTARAKKAAKVAAEQRTAKRLAAERAAKPTKKSNLSVVEGIDSLSMGRPGICALPPVAAGTPPAQLLLLWGPALGYRFPGW